MFILLNDYTLKIVHHSLFIFRKFPTVILNFKYQNKICIVVKKIKNKTKIHHLNK